MGIPPREKIDEVRERTDLVEIVKRYVDLRKASADSWKGLCPFHQEKTPSFHVHEHRRYYYCFGCGAKGDVFNFLQEIEGKRFPEVLRELAEEAAIELPDDDLSPGQRRAIARAESEKTRMFRIMEMAVAFFSDALSGPAGDAGRRYLEGRGLDADTITKFRLGYAPAGFDNLLKHLVKNQVPLEAAEQLGLVGRNARGRYDFFRDRVMLPVLDRQRRPVGFSSRLLDPDAKERKYVNSPDSPLFHKKEQLYGIHAAADAIRRTGRAVVVEGNFDVMTLFQSGLESAVAPMGTALTLEQVRLLGRFASKVYLVFDGDDAGRRAGQKALTLFLEAGVDGRIVRLPQGSDPDAFVLSQGREGLERLLETARPLVEQFIDELSKETDGSIPGRVAALEKAATVLHRVSNRTELDLYMGQVAVSLGISPSQVFQAVRNEAAKHRQRKARQASLPQKNANPNGAGGGMSGGGAGRATHQNFSQKRKRCDCRYRRLS